MSPTLNQEQKPIAGTIWRMLLRSDPAQVYFLYLPTKLSVPARLLVSVHGISRNAKEHMAAFAPHAERLGLVLIAPLFDAARFKGYQRLEWSEYGLASHTMLRRILGDVGQFVPAQQDRIFLTGHSGGAQFAHRYVMAFPELVARYAISAAGWYTMPDEELRYPYGLAKPAQDIQLNPNRFLAVPGRAYVGALDNERDEALNKSKTVDRTQGRNRVERAAAWVAAMRNATVLHGLTPSVDLEICESAGHEFLDLVEQSNMADKICEYLFQN